MIRYEIDLAPATIGTVMAAASYLDCEAAIGFEYLAEIDMFRLSGMGQDFLRLADVLRDTGLLLQQSRFGVLSRLLVNEMDLLDNERAQAAYWN